MLNSINNSVHQLHFRCSSSLLNIWKAKNLATKFAKYTLIIPIILAFGVGVTIPWRWVVNPTVSRLLQPPANKTNKAATRALGNIGEIPLPILFEKIPEHKKSKLTFEEHPFYNLHPEKPVFEDFQHFQINCNGGKVAYHENFQRFEGPQINRYNTAGIQNAALLSQIQLTPEMAQKLPYLPKEFIDTPISNAFITIWGNLPNQQAGIGGGEHLMFRPETLVGQVPNSHKKFGKGLYPLKIGIFTDINSGIIPVDRQKEAADLPTGLAVNEGLKQCKYDCHGENDNPAIFFEDDIYLTSVMGTFDLDKRSVHAFTAIATLDQKEAQYEGFAGLNKMMVSYQIILSDQLTTEMAPLFHEAENLRDLLKKLHTFGANLDRNDPGAQVLQKGVIDLIRVFS